MIKDIDFREATQEDLPEITAIYRDTIRAVNSKDYSEEQIEAWSSGADDTKKWQDRIKKFYFLVAEVDNQIVGFSYLKQGYYLENIFVHKDFQRQTIASKLLRIMESQVSINGNDTIKSDISISALDFFDSHFYDVEKKLKKSFKGKVFDILIVTKDL
ncbi:GNAT family N-acetyltransferase [Psychroserpens ponticola]|uniref:GNAT family N-acetyltransferase n=1 Tax=Psychroserpens ponticola TaxID=2932268 RepID=A0ABY7RUS1_9FLAO|nr:GNAT family N-acetyltransferase [Psychroserpens ponticola]WCO00849.1 GNAT family N-acetyltransferase [Psychroserpens ponticola]